MWAPSHSCPVRYHFENSFTNTDKVALSPPSAHPSSQAHRYRSFPHSSLTILLYREIAMVEVELQFSLCSEHFTVFYFLSKKKSRVLGGAIK
jgi:hypothetical protein